MKKRLSFTKKDILTIVVIFAAAVVMAFNIKSFVRTAGLYPGGANGLTILIQHISESTIGVELSFTVINLLINSIPIYIGFRYVGKKFTFFSLLMIIVAGVITDLIPGIVITEDTLLISIFGGIINGCAISMCLLSGATFGGTDIIAIFLSERKGIDAFNIVLGFNALILAAAGILFGWDKALYSIIFQYVSTVTIRLLYRKFQRSTLFIVTNKPQEVSDVIYATSQHGATILEGEGSFGHCERNVVYSVVDKPQAKRVIKAVKTCDPDAFINEVRTERLAGNFYQKPEE